MVLFDFVSLETTKTGTGQSQKAHASPSTSAQILLPDFSAIESYGSVSAHATRLWLLAWGMQGGFKRGDYSSWGYSRLLFPVLRPLFGNPKTGLFPKPRRSASFLLESPTKGSWPAPDLVCHSLPHQQDWLLLPWTAVG